MILHPKFSANPKIITFSMVVFISVVFSSYGYIEGLSFFKILFKWNLGWWYPVSILVTVGAIYADYARQVKSMEELADKKP